MHFPTVFFTTTAVLGLSAGFVSAESAHEYPVASDSALKVGNDAVRIRQETQCPWDGKVGIPLETEADVALKLRIPGWAGGIHEWKVEGEEEYPTTCVAGHGGNGDCASKNPIYRRRLQ
jgi:hypothetical protein